MTSKRHLVLYALGVLLLMGLASVFLIVRKDSLAEQAQNMATTTVLVEKKETKSESTAKPAATKPFQFEIVTTEELQAKGLGGRTEVPSDYGMLFVFEDKALRGFWMKDMLVPIDIIWLSDAGVVVGIEEAVTPASYPTVFSPSEPVRYVLETRAHEAVRLGIEEGTKLNLPLPYGR